MNELLFTQKDLETQFNEVFQKRCPPILWIHDLGPTECGEGNQFYWAFARKSLVPNPVAFYLRAGALFFADSYVFDDGSPFPGYSRLTVEEVESLSKTEIREHLLDRTIKHLTYEGLKDLERWMGAPPTSLTLELRGKFLRGIELHHKDQRGFFWETEKYWGFIDWWSFW